MSVVPLDIPSFIHRLARSVASYIEYYKPSARMRSEGSVVVLSVCVRASSSTTGYEAANEWHHGLWTTRRLILVEMLIVGERERPNLGFVCYVRAAQLSFREARQRMHLSAYCILPERSAGEQNGPYWSTRQLDGSRLGSDRSGCPADNAAWSTRQLTCSSMCTSNASAWNHDDWEEVQPRSVTEGCRACRRMGSTEESSLAG